MDPHDNISPIMTAISPSTPMMIQWEECKKEAKDALLLFRLGDFYEAFQQDAVVLAKELSLTLTARQAIPMCGVPFHAAEGYIDKLIHKGYKVAIAEQTKNSVDSKGLIKREIVRIFTPGTFLSSQQLLEKKNNFFASISQTGALYGLSCLDLTTGEFRVVELSSKEELLDELVRLKPRECLVQKNFQNTHPHFFEELSYLFPFLLNTRDNIDPAIAFQTLTGHFDVNNLDRFGLRGQPAAIGAAGALMLHLKEELNLDLEEITSIQTTSLSKYMNIDRATLSHLELIQSLGDKSSKGTLLELLDHTVTPMGGRLFSYWMTHPLLSIVDIQERQQVIQCFLSHSSQHKKARSILEQVRDVERLLIRLSTRMGGPRDLYSLAFSLSHAQAFKIELSSLPSPKLQSLLDPIDDFSPLFNKILSALQETLPLRIGEGDIFRSGYHEELDRLRQLSRDSIQWIGAYQNKLRTETGIKTLKVGFTRAFGYYIEVSKSYSDKGDKIPSFFQRRQTLTNGERYSTEELKQFEHQILTAEERSKALEEELFEALRKQLLSYTNSITHAAKQIAHIDALLSLAQAASLYNWVCPIVEESDILDIQEGRHPVVERAIGKHAFIGNDTFLSKDKQMMLITGPNMAGKSTYIRQVALIVILAQIGSYVPATYCRLGLIDKLFSRIGASDNLSKGHSTFMVEMSETANILNHATSRSLVLLDEIGRGTSTYDGISIAWAVAEFLLTTHRRQAKTLFATHYWELTRLEEKFSHALNFQTAIEETASDIVFLRKIIRGGTDKSYGIHVAKLAGIPLKAIRRAEEMLRELEAHTAPKPKKKEEQLSLFFEEAPPSAIENELKNLDLNQFTPIQALQRLVSWQKTLLSH